MDLPFLQKEHPAFQFKFSPFFGVGRVGVPGSGLQIRIRSTTLSLCLMAGCCAGPRWTRRRVSCWSITRMENTRPCSSSTHGSATREVSYLHLAHLDLDFCLVIALIVVVPIPVRFRSSVMLRNTVLEVLSLFLRCRRGVEKCNVPSEMSSWKYAISFLCS